MMLNQDYDETGMVMTIGVRMREVEAIVYRMQRLREGLADHNLDGHQWFRDHCEEQLQNLANELLALAVSVNHLRTYAYLAADSNVARDQFASRALTLTTVSGK